MRRRIVLVSGIVANLAFAFEGARYLRWNEIQASVPDATVTDSKQWDSWIRKRDFEIRSSTDQCIEDSISTLIMLGTSFTTQPRLVNPAQAVNAAGGLTPAARVRLDAFMEGLDQIDDERFRSVLQFLRRRQIAQDELRVYLTGNLRRAALERARNQRMHSASVGASLIEPALRGLMSTGKAPTRIRRIAVIGPGLDPEYDPETYNLFASLEASLTMALAKPGNVEIVVLDIHPWVLSHVRAVASKAGERYGARIRAEDLNVIAQTAPGQGFDLVVAASGLSSYSRIEQTLVLANVAQMMASGGVFLANGNSSMTIPPEFEVLGGPTGEGMMTYRRR
jgi:hypothetical protein